MSGMRALLPSPLMMMMMSCAPWLLLLALVVSVSVICTSCTHVGSGTVIGGLVGGVVVESVVESVVGSVAWVCVVSDCASGVGMATVLVCVLLAGFGPAASLQLGTQWLRLPMSALLLRACLWIFPGLCLCLLSSLSCILDLFHLCLGSPWC